MASLTQTQMEANALLREHGLADAGWYFVWDSAKRRGGQCVYSRKQISMSKYLVPLWTEEEVRNTLLHEIAHALAGHAAGHGPAWKRTARMIGCDANRTHSNPVPDKPWASVCQFCGVIGTTHRRNKVACGRCYRLKGMMVPITYRRNPALDNQLATR